jgi:hypothetical protein
MNIRMPLIAAAATLSLAFAAGTARADLPKRLAPGPWTTSEEVSLNLSQSAFSNNWSGGDRGSIVAVAGSVTCVKGQVRTGFNQEFKLRLAYGKTEQQASDPANPGRNLWGTPDKTTDQILFESTGRFTAAWIADPFLALRVESQFEDQSNPAGVLNLNPIKITESGGFARALAQTDTTSTITRLGFGFRQTIGRTLLGASPRTIASFHSNDGGIQWQTDVTQPLLDRHVMYTGSLLVFKPLFYSKSTALEQFDRAARAAYPGREAVAGFWKVAKVNFQNAFVAQITKRINVNLAAQLVYDKFDVAASVDDTQPLAGQIADVDRNVRKAGQFKEALALGFTYRWE